MPVAGVQWNHRFVVGRPQWAPLARTERSRRNGQNAPFVKRMIKSFWNAPAAAHRRVDQSCWLGVATWLTLGEQGGRRFKSSHPDHPSSLLQREHGGA